MVFRNGIVVCASVALLAVAGCAANSGSDGSDGDATTLTFASTGSEFQEWQKQAWQEPYADAAGVEFVNDTLDEAKLKAMVDSGKVAWDVMDLSAGPTYQYCGEYLQELDFEVIDREQFPPETVNECGVPAYYFTQMFLYNSKEYGDKPPTTSADFFDTDSFPGKRLIPPEL